jgi:hypothetical protein
MAAAAVCVMELLLSLLLLLLLGSVAECVWDGVAAFLCDGSCCCLCYGAAADLGGAAAGLHQYAWAVFTYVEHCVQRLNVTQ